MAATPTPTVPRLRTQSIHLLTATILGLMCAGCVGHRQRAVSAYTGPTEPVYDVISEINRNNAAMPSIWARHYFEATVVDDKKKSHFVNGEGILLYRAPGEMRLVGKKDLAGTIFEMGSAGDDFWLHLVPEIDTLWHGSHHNIGKPCVEAIPIRPDLVVQVLGLATFDTNLHRPPVPVMRFNGDQDAYMFVWNAPLTDRWVVQKEIWYDRQTKLPKLVLLFDENGRVLLRAYLSNHEPVEVKGTESTTWPRVATHFDLYFPDTGTSMKFDLRDVAMTNKGIPKAGSIRLPDLASLTENGTNVVQVDAKCEK